MAEGPYPIGRCNGMIIIWIRTIVRIVRANCRERDVMCLFSILSNAARGGELFMCSGSGQKGPCLRIVQ